MDDLISRQQALDAVGKYASVWMEYTDAMSKDEIAQIALNNAKSTMIRILKELPTIQPEVLACGNGELVVQPEPQWIPVSERLPEESGWYICTCHDGVSERVTFLKWQKRLKQWEKTGTRSYWKVIAWMPLPEPYKPNNE